MMKHVAVFIAYNCVQFYQLYLKCLGIYIFSSIYLLNFWLLNFCIVLHSICYFQYFWQFFDLISEFQTLSGIFKFFVVSVSSSYLTAFLICFLFVRWTVCCSLNHWCPLLHIVSMTFANLFWLSCKHFLGFLDREATYTCSWIPNNCDESIMYNASVQEAHSIVCLHDALKNCFQDSCKKIHRSYILLLFRSFFLRCSGSMRFQLLKVWSRSSPRLSDL
jgi:hypothetical protein